MTIACKLWSPFTLLGGPARGQIICMEIVMAQIDKLKSCTLIFIYPACPTLQHA